MAFDAHVLKVLIASPGDTGPERDAIEKALTGWNGARAEREQVILTPWRWEHHAVPTLGGPAQEVINAQAVDVCDIVIAVFDSCLGTATDNAVSGTAEEIARAHTDGKPVHVWFSQEPLPRDMQPEELQRLNSFKLELQRIGLLGKYANPEDLQYQVRNAIEHDVNAMDLGRVILRDGKTAQARKITALASPVPSALGTGLWSVRVANDSNGPIVNLVADVYLVDESGQRIDGKCALATEDDIAGTAAKLFGSVLSGGFGSTMGPGMSSLVGGQLSPVVKAKFQEVLRGQLADGFSSTLSAEKDSVVVYSVAPGVQVRVDIEFTDEAGHRWMRRNGDEPEPSRNAV